MIAEVTIPSHGVGYEIGHAIASGQRRVLLLHRPFKGKKLSAMLGGIPEDRATVRQYEDVDQAEEIFKEFFGAIGENNECCMLI